LKYIRRAHPYNHNKIYHTFIFQIVFQTVLWVIAFIHIYPIVIIFLSSLKSTMELAENPGGLPKKITFEFFILAFKSLNYFRSLFNTLFIAIISVAVLILTASLAAYAITRRNKRFYKALYIFFMAGIIVPFQMTMLPLYKFIKFLGLMNTRAAVIFIYLALLSPFSVFVFCGYMKNVPRQLEESAIIDGCGVFNIFLRIVFPLLKPAIGTVAVLNVISIWNDFFMPMLFLQKNTVRTLIVQISVFFGQYFSDWSSIFASICLIVYPMVIIYIFAQNFIIGGITSGAVKG